ncbi:MAG TPA: tetratricopeptide repeat protein, partial [Pyrinomonadaceae bacterium]|nr:tetratricopeptide repeat protein [Pyrinomonadaceae bacterium]
MTGTKTMLLAAALLLFAGAVGAQSAKDEAPGLAELKKGEYARAVELLGARLKSNPSDAAAQKHLLRAFLEQGRYTEAEASARLFLQKQPEAGGVRHELAEALVATGRYAEAATEFERAGKDSATNRLASELRRAEVLEMTGQEEQAREIFRSFVSYYSERSPETAPELTLVARALVHLEKYQDAKDLFTEAIQADETYIEAHLGGGRLFTEKYNYAEAAEFYQDALEINPNSAPAHLGVAANKRLEGGEGMSAALARALEINPNLVEARAFKASLELEAGDHDAAAAEIEKALNVNPR